MYPSRGRGPLGRGEIDVITRYTPIITEIFSKSIIFPVLEVIVENELAICIGVGIKQEQKVYLCLGWMVCLTHCTRGSFASDSLKAEAVMLEFS